MSFGVASIAVSSSGSGVLAMGQRQHPTTPHPLTTSVNTPVKSASDKDTIMTNVIANRSTHAGKLERWLGKEQVENISTSMLTWHGTRPILVGGVPGAGGVWVGRGGDFVGNIDGGGFIGLAERCVERVDHAVSRVANRHRMNGFSSLSDLINEVSNFGKRRDFTFSKIGSASVIGGTNSFWRQGNYPSAGGAAANAPGGAALTDASAGAFPFINPTSPDTQHFVRADIMTTIAPRTTLLYDRIFEVNKTMASITTEAVSGVPTRYQNTTSNQPDSADGNFLGIEIQAALGATAHNWTVCTYTDQNGNAATLPLMVGNASGIINRLDHPLNQWFAPLDVGDSGIRTLTQMQCSASVTGTVAFFIGHPLAFLPTVVTNMITIVDGINTAFNLARVFDDACLALLDVNSPSASGATVNGMFMTAAG
jgi:hypothetical protein